MIKTTHVRTIIEYSLLELGSSLATKSAIEMMMLTAAQETLLGYYLYQDDGDPEIELHLGLGVYQMERATHNYVQRTRVMKDPRFQNVPVSNAIRMVYDLKYATQMGRINYTRFREAFPEHTNIHAMADYYKRYWNTYAGSATVEEAVKNYHEYVLEG